MKWRKSKENGGKFWLREERSISRASSGELTSTLQLIYSYELVGMLKCSHLTGKLWMLLEGKFGFTMEHIGRSGIILVFPMLKTWNYGEEGRLLQHWTLNACDKFSLHTVLERLYKLGAFGSNDELPRIFVLNRIH